MERARRIVCHCTGAQEADGFKEELSLTLHSTRSPLTAEQRAFYEENGYIVIRGLLDSQELTVLEERFESLCRGDTETLVGMSVMRDISVSKSEKSSAGKNSRLITKIQDWQDDEVLFSGYCKNPKILDYVESFTGPDVRSIHTMIIQKPVVSNAPSSRHPLHQDLVYFPFRPADRIVCSWTCMEERISRENGGLVVIPGSHKPPVGSGSIYPHSYPSDWERVNKLYYGIEMDEGLRETYTARKVYLDMKRGDTVFFHPLLIHGSGANKSTQYKYRKAISCHYASTHCTGIADLRGTLQEEIAQEAIDMVVSRYGVDPNEVNYLTLWLFKSRQVRGSLPGK